MNKRPTDPIYLDHSATTPVREEVLAAMQPYFADFYGNPSSIHGVGRRAGVALANARRDVASVLGAKPSEIIFTGGGSESDNAALRGIALARREQTGANRLITAPTEHKAVLYTAFDLRDHYGFELTLLPVDAAGRVDVKDVASALGDVAPGGGARNNDVAVVSIMYANNEVGTIQPIAENWRALPRARRALPLRRGAGRRQAAAECGRAERGRAKRERAQILWTQGRWLFVFAQRHALPALCHGW